MLIQELLALYEMKLTIQIDDWIFDWPADWTEGDLENFVDNQEVITLEEWELLDGNKVKLVPTTAAFESFIRDFSVKSIKAMLNNAIRRFDPEDYHMDVNDLHPDGVDDDEDH